MDNLKREIEEELRRDARHEELMRSDFDYAIEVMDFNPFMTLKQFKNAIYELREYYGWELSDVDICDLFNTYSEV